MNKSVILVCAFLIAPVVFSKCSPPAQANPPVRRAAARPTGRPAPAQGGANNAAYQAYLNGVRAKVARNWLPADGKHHVVLTTMMLADGTTQDLNSVSTPKSTEAEQSASDAFAKSLPFSALPAGIIVPAKLTLTFDSNCDPHGDSKSNLSTNLESAPKQPATPKNEAAPADSK